VETELTREKALRPAHGTALGAEISGYEMHMGVTTGADTASPFALLSTGPDGAVAPGGRVLGTYLHGLFASTALRRAVLERIGVTATDVDYAASVDTALDAIAAELETHVDIPALIALAQEASR